MQGNLSLNELQAHDSRDLINISIKNITSIQDIQILNAGGQIVFDKKVNANDGILDESINVSSLPKGIYILRAINDKGEIVKRFIKE